MLKIENYVLENFYYDYMLCVYDVGLSGLELLWARQVIYVILSSSLQASCMPSLLKLVF